MTTIDRTPGTDRPGRRWVSACAVYVVASLILGPAVLVGGYALFTTGGGDYCDSSYGLFNAADIATVGAIRRDAEFRTVEIVQAIGGGILFAIGLVILIGLWRARCGLARVRGTVAALAVAAVMVGYAVVALSPAAIPGC